MNKKILRLAIPNIISNISVPLLGLVDLAIMGHLESENYIGAIALGGMIFNFIYWNFSFLRMGTSGFTAQAFGARNLKESVAILSRSLMVGFAGALLLILGQTLIADLSFFLVKGSIEVESLASQYFLIRIWAAPATIGLYSLTGWFIGMQNAKTPMYISIAVNILNILFSLIFVYGMGMKADGVALGTVIAQYAGFILAVIMLSRYYKKLLKYWVYSSIMQWEKFVVFFKVNKDIFIRTFCLIFVFTFFTAQSANSGDTILAVNTLLLQFFMVFSYLIDGFAYSAESLVGKSIGARNPVQLKKVVRLLFLWGLAISIIFTLTYLVAGDKLLLILTDNNNVIEQTQPYLFWIVFIPIITFTAFLWDGIYIGALASKGMRNSMLISTILVFLPLYFLLHPLLENNGLWLALNAFMITRGITLTIMAKKEIFSRI